jgi:CRP-like cAMP-binding protein
MKEMLTNKILTGLPEAEFTRLVPLLEPVSLSAGERLVESGETARFIYFPENAVISCLADMQDGKSVEVAMVGNDGATGLYTLLGTRPAAHSINVTVTGSALKMWKDDFLREFQRGDGLRQSVLNYTGEYLLQVSQRAACAILHRMEQRMAVWLLLLADRLDTDVIEITQERIANHLGVRRAGVTAIAGGWQDLGAVSYSRGHLRVVDRRALEAIACECYGAMTRERQENSYM